MKHLLSICLLLLTMSVQAQLIGLQPKAMRVYRVNDQVMIRDSAAAKSPDVFSSSAVSVGPGRNSVRVTVDYADMYFPITKFLKSDGTPYSTVSVDAAVNAYVASLPTTGGPTSLTGLDNSVTKFTSLSDVISLITSATTTNGGYAAKYAGKKAVFLGNSIVARNDWTAMLSTALNMTPVNLGIGAGALTNGGTVWQSLSNIPNDADFIFLVAGGAEYLFNQPLGTSSDTTNTTFHGALFAAGRKIMAEHPTAKLFYLSEYPFGQGAYSVAIGATNAGGNTQLSFFNAVRDQGRRLGNPYIHLGDGQVGDNFPGTLADKIHFTNTGAVKAYAYVYNWLRNYDPSPTAPTPTAVATPQFSPDPLYSSTSSITVTITSATSGAEIRYTTDGSTPTGSSTLYSAPFSLSTSTTVKAIGIKSGLTNSAVGMANYTISTSVAVPQFSPVAGTYSSSLSVGITNSTAGATMYVTTDGSTPTTSSPVYSSAISVTATSTIKVLAVKSGLTSTTASAAYTITTATTGTFSCTDVTASVLSGMGTNTFSVNGDGSINFTQSGGIGGVLINSTYNAMQFDVKVAGTNSVALVMGTGSSGYLYINLPPSGTAGYGQVSTSGGLSANGNLTPSANTTGAVDTQFRTYRQGNIFTVLRNDSGTWTQVWQGNVTSQGAPSTYYSVAQTGFAFYTNWYPTPYHVKYCNYTP
ncbi:chitobiase/beta-hexosaminidase C-terminal domain-containing protein [Spirosoma flavus]